jgi:hypothetical protein
MVIRMTCTALRDTHAVDDVDEQLLPNYVVDREVVDPAVSWVRAMREARDLCSVRPGWIANSYPPPDGDPWSAREVVPEKLPYQAECWYSEAAWRQRLPGSRLQVRAETYDPGFTVVWTLEILRKALV